MSVYRGMDQAALDAAYDNTSAVGESARILADWERRSSELARARPEFLDRRYGPRERNRIDYFPAARDASPVLVFVHGGYWQMRAKETFRFLADGPLAHGIAVALVGYTLAPEAALPEIIGEVQAAISWIAAHAPQMGGDPQRLYVSGWSAGGHLTAMSLEHPAVRGGLAVSGIFDLEPIRLSFLNRKLGLEAGQVTALSPLANLPAASPPLVVAYGTGELPELQRQSRDYVEARRRAGLAVTLAALPRHNHFTILEELANPDGALTALLLELVR